MNCSIQDQTALETFLNGNTCKDYLQFLERLQDSVKGKDFKNAVYLPNLVEFEKYFQDVRQVLMDTPPIEGKMRFGNVAFKDFHEKILPVNTNFLLWLQEKFNFSYDFVEELEQYLSGSYGDNMRIDYGTGHELNFMIALYCLNKLGVFKEIQDQDVVQIVFYDYIFTMRMVQIQYNLEPAGSHGVWGLDDYHFLPFIFGASELIDSDLIRKPSDGVKAENIELYSDRFMYLNCLQFIQKVKKNVPLHMSSPYLWDISGAESWFKVSKGLIKMYQKEVLGRIVVIKHLKFGKLFPYE